MQKAMSLNLKNNSSSIIKGCLVAIGISLVCILLFALVIKFVNLSDIAIKIINQIIKVISVFFGVKVCLKKDNQKGLIKGGLVGLFYTIFSYLIFSILIVSFSFDLSIVYDIIFSTLIGVICGIIFANVKRI